MEKIRYRCPISIFGGFIQYQAIPISDDNSMQQMFRTHQQHQANIACIELYVDFREVAIAIKPEPSMRETYNGKIASVKVMMRSSKTNMEAMAKVHLMMWMICK